MEMFGVDINDMHRRPIQEDILGLLRIHHADLVWGDSTVCRYLENEDWMREVITYFAPPSCRVVMPSATYLNKKYGTFDMDTTVLDMAVLNHYPLFVIEKLVALGCKMTMHCCVMLVAYSKKHNMLMYTKEEIEAMFHYLKSHPEIRDIR